MWTVRKDWPGDCLGGWMWKQVQSNVVVERMYLVCRDDNVTKGHTYMSSGLKAVATFDLAKDVHFST